MAVVAAEECGAGGGGHRFSCYEACAAIMQVWHSLACAACEAFLAFALVLLSCVHLEAKSLARLMTAIFATGTCEARYVRSFREVLRIMGQLVQDKTAKQDRRRC